MTQPEIAQRLLLIEQMIAEGQRTVGQWGWAWVLWGVGHSAAVLWSELLPGPPALPWLVLMPLCGVAMGIGAVIARRRAGKATPLDRQIAGLWWAFGISLGLAWGVGASRGFYADAASFYFVFYLLVGAANYGTGVALRLPLQRGAAGLWWVAGALTAFYPQLAAWILLAAAIACEILFGAYLMRLETRPERP